MENRLNSMAKKPPNTPTPIGYYVYAFLREDLTPYYIGKGNSTRAWVTRRKRTKPPLDLSRIVILQDGLDHQAALDYEVKLIKLFGRVDQGNGILHNFTDGGEGIQNPSADTREKMRQAKLGKPRSEGSRKRQAATLTGKLRPHVGPKISIAKMGHKTSVETRAKMSAAKLGKKLTEEHRAKISKTLVGRPKEPRTSSHSEKLSSALKGKPWSDARKAAQRSKQNSKNQLSQ